VWLPFACCAALALAALALRLYALDRQSMWADEGSSLALASRPLLQIAQDTARDVHPPLYYWLLHNWMLLFGQTPAALRGFSALCGALAAALTAALAWRWFGGGAALVAGIAAAFSPFAIHYSQEARMYALLLLLATLTWMALTRALTPSEAGHRPDATAHRPVVTLLLYCGVALAALYTHYYAVTLVAATFLAGAVALAARKAARAIFLRWLAAHAALGMLYVPWVWYSRERLSGWASAAAGPGPIEILGDILRVFSIGVSTPPGFSPVLLFFALLLAAGLLLPLRNAPGVPGRMWAAIWLLAPIAVMLFLALDRPFYRPRFLILALPAFHLLLGRGAAALAQLVVVRFGFPARALPIAFALALALSAAAPLRNEWFDPAYWRDDYRGIAQAIAAAAAPEDIVIANGQGQLDTLRVYDPGGLPYRLVPRARPLDPAVVTADLAALARDHRRLYALFYVLYEADPAGVIPNWLAEHAFHAGSRWYGGVQLAIYDLQPPPGDARAFDARFGAAAVLRSAAYGPLQLHPGESLRLTTAWESPDTRLNIFVHLVDATGTPAAQYDGPLVDRPAAGDGVRRMALLAPATLAPGRYRLLIGLYDPATGARVPLANGAAALELAEVVVVSDAR
jgi:4-amino-4-deoxy-L-arabinose transferase-like glycosyltransferase